MTITIETDLEALDESNLELEEIRIAVQEGIEQAERGEGRPAHEVFTELRAKFKHT